MPRRMGEEGNTQLRKNNWCFNQYRSVVYLQTPKQKEKLFKDLQKKRIGLDKQISLIQEYHSKKRDITYIEWCQNKDSLN